jgi:hypothetical protein
MYTPWSHHSFFISALARDKWLDLLSGRFTPGIHWIERWVGFTPRLDILGEEKSLFRLLNLCPESSVPWSSHYAEVAAASHWESEET